MPSVALNQKMRLTMTKIIRSDGNGCIILSKWLAAVIALFTLISIIWNVQTSYFMQTTVTPIRMDVTKIESRVSALESGFLANRERLVRIESKLDMLVGMIQRPNNDTPR